jgi:hypothetical protein
VAAVNQPSQLPLGRTFTLDGGGKSGVDFGNVEVASIGGRVFNDLDVSGSFTSGDTAAASKIVKLYRAPSLTDPSTWTFVKDATSNATGVYSLDNVDLGQYAVCLASIGGQGETLPTAKPDTPKSTYCAGGEPGGLGGPDFYRGYGFALTATGAQDRDFGITPAICSVPFSVPGYEIHLPACKPGQSFVVAYDDGATKLASVRPIRTDLPPVAMTEKITWTIPASSPPPALPLPRLLRQFTLLYDDTLPYGDTTPTEMPYCRIDPRAVGSEFDLKLVYQDPANAGDVIPGWPAHGYPSSLSNPGNTSCIINEQTTVQATSGGAYVVRIYSAIDGWRSTP